MKKLLLLITHTAAIALGFALGIYALPILIAPEGPSVAEVQSLAKEAAFKGEFRRDLKGSDMLHWGEGTLAVGPKNISLMGTLAPGPDYKLYLSPEFIDTEAAFLKIKQASLRVGDVKTFDNFVLAIPDSVDLSQFTTVVIWCETFSQFITAAQYR